MSLLSSFNAHMLATGFFSPVSDSLLEQVGRGDTNLAAALPVAGGLGASEMQCPLHASSKSDTDWCHTNVQPRNEVEILEVP